MLWEEGKQKKEDEAGKEKKMEIHSYCFPLLTASNSLKFLRHNQFLKKFRLSKVQNKSMLM